MSNYTIDKGAVHRGVAVFVLLALWYAMQDVKQIRRDVRAIRNEVNPRERPVYPGGEPTADEEEDDA